MIWIIRGAPGVGKSAVGRRLKKRIPSSAVIEVDILRSMRSDINWTDETSHRVGLQQAATLAESFIKIGMKPVIIIDTLLGNNLDYFRSLLSQSPLTFTLIAEDVALLKRAKGRVDGFQNEKIISEMNKSFRRSEGADAFVIDTTFLSADQVTDKILELTNGTSKTLLLSDSNKNTERTEDKNHSESNLEPDGRLYLIRHSEPEKKFSGPSNIYPGSPLSANGIEKAERLRDFFRGFQISKLVCSAFERASQTASIIAGSYVTPLESEAWNEVGPSEPFSDVRKRVRGWLQNNYPVKGEIILVVGHGATLNAAIEFYNPEAFKDAKKDHYGNTVGKAGVWLVEWLNGKVIYCGPIKQ